MKIENTSQKAQGATLPTLGIMIPAYNEARRIERTLAATTDYLERRGASYVVTVVDDGSADDTATVVERWSAAHPLRFGVVRTMGYGGNRGKGYAVRYGVLRSDDADRVLIMDADLATPIEEIQKLEAALESNSCAVAIGSRPLAASQLLVRQPWYREVSGRVFNGVVQILATPGIHDTQCGFKLLTGDAARDIFSRCRLDGFSFDVEALLLARKRGFPIAEVPVRWAHQEGAAAFATTGAYLRHGLRMLGELVRIRWTHRGVRRFRGKVAAPAGSVRATRDVPSA